MIFRLKKKIKMSPVQHRQGLRHRRNYGLGTRSEGGFKDVVKVVLAQPGTS